MRPKEIIINIINDLILPKPNSPLNTLKLAITTDIITMIGGIATIKLWFINNLLTYKNIIP